jgi:hypothetical protein
MATGLDHFGIVYRFGAIFLSESKPRGRPARPAEKLPGARRTADEVEFTQDRLRAPSGRCAATRRGGLVRARQQDPRRGLVPQAPGSDHVARATAGSRMLFKAIADPARTWMRKDALRRLRQLDAMTRWTRCALSLHARRGRRP